MSDSLPRIRVIIAGHAGVEASAVGEDQPLGDPLELGGLEFDSLDRIELAIKIGEAFGVDIPDEDVDNPELGTARGIATYIDRARCDEFAAGIIHEPGTGENPLEGL